jgi:hypothetical protein
MPTGGTLVFAVNSLFYLNQVAYFACALCMFPMPTGGTLVISLFYLSKTFYCE